MLQVDGLVGMLLATVYEKYFDLSMKFLDFLENCDTMWRKCVWSSSIAASLASKYLSASGLLVLTGAHAALQATPSSYAYDLPFTCSEPL